MASKWQEQIGFKNNAGAWLTLGVVALFAIPAFRRTLRTITVRTLAGAWGAADALIILGQRPPKRLTPTKAEWATPAGRIRMPVDFDAKHSNVLKGFEEAVQGVGAEFKPEAGQLVDKLRQE